jgi:Animal haem peroxidase
MALSDTAPPKPVSDVVSKVLASVGLSPFASNNPLAPVDSPAMWAMLAMARKREEVEEPSSFGRMFGDLEPLNQQTNEQLRLEAQEMLEGQAIANPKGTTGGITFFGQFIDHDLTLDTLPQPAAPVDVNTLVNGRTFAFDLDSVYGGGRKKSPQLYDGDKFKLGLATDGVSPDLPRDPETGRAILVEARNDENLIIAQIHLSFLRLHNSLVDQGMSFDDAHDTVVNAYRYVVLNDYLPQIVGEDAVDAALKRPVERGYYQPGKDTPFTPVEFAVATFRFGHSQVRNAYNINDESGGVPVFSFDPDPAVGDLSGGRQLPANRIIDFDNFFSELPQDGGPLLIGRAIDTNIAQSLFQLPIPGAEGGGDNVLAFRNLLRAKFYDMPSGEAVAEAMGFEPLRDADGKLVPPTFPEGTPLWLYVLREAEITSGGAELGPVGGGIVAEVFVDLLRQDNQKTIYQTKVNLPDVSGGDFRVGDLLVAADQPLGEEPQPPAEQPCRDGGARPILDSAHEGPRRHRLHQQLHRADDSARERSGRHRLHQQLHEQDDPAPGRHRLFEQLHGVRV